MYRPAPGIAVPRLERVPSTEGYSVVPQELHVFAQAPESVLRLRVTRWLNEPTSQRSQRDRLDSADLAQIRALTGAALRDIAALTSPAVMEWLSPGLSHERAAALMNGGPVSVHGDTKVTRRRVAEGRRLWQLIGGWPWWPLADAGESLADGFLPSNWWTHPRVAECFAEWLGLGQRTWLP